MERVLEACEKPLQIALDCSSKGLAPPKFIFRTPLSASPKLQARKFTSYVKPAYAGSSESGDSPSPMRMQSKLPYMDTDQNSVNSFGSANSLTSNKSTKSKSTPTLTLKSKKRPLMQTLSNQESYVTPNSSPTQSPQLQSSRKASRPKSVMTNFITRSLRVRRKSKPALVPAEEAPPSPILQDEDSDTGSIPNMVSPQPIERRFNLSAVMHIYFTAAKRPQVYKSVLVSESATANEVIAQALERYSMKFNNPDHYSLYEVIGRWQDVTRTLPSQMSFHTEANNSMATNVTNTMPSFPLNTSPLVQRRTSVEEFVVCYSRELAANESPYSAQIYLTTQDGYTRRFELREKDDKPRSNATHSESNAPGTATGSAGSGLKEAAVKPTKEPTSEFSEDGIFGHTANRRRARRNRIVQQQQQPIDTVDLPAASGSATELLASNPDSEVRAGDSSLRMREVEGEHEEEEEEEEQDRPPMRVVEVKTAPQEILSISVNPSHPPDFAMLACSSPDSGVGFHNLNKDRSGVAFSSVSSDQSDHNSTPAAKASAGSCGLYNANLETGFLLSLKLHSPEHECLVHKLDRATTSLVSSDATDCQDSSCSTITLHHPELAGLRQPLCCICRQQVTAFSTDDDAHQNGQERYIYKVQTSESSTISVLLNGRSIRGTAEIRHGDLLTIGSNYMFIFQDYSSVDGEHIPDYSWKPHPVDHSSQLHSTPQRAAKKPPGVAGSCHLKSDKGCEGKSQADSTKKAPLVHTPPASRKVEALANTVKTSSQPRRGSRGKVVEPTAAHQKCRRTSSTNPHDIDAKTQSLTRGEQNLSFEGPDVFEPGAAVELSSPSKEATALTRHLHNGVGAEVLNSRAGRSLPSDRKLMFSFQASEEDALLDYVIMSEDVYSAACKLAPAYILAMCVEYSMRCNGPAAAGRFVRKAVDHIQAVVWVSQLHTACMLHTCSCTCTCTHIYLHDIVHLFTVVFS